MQASMRRQRGQHSAPIEPSPGIGISQTGFTD
jgi:hypothetical protein